jgi:hypothetical protein
MTNDNGAPKRPAEHGLNRLSASADADGGDVIAVVTIAGKRGRFMATALERPPGRIRATGRWKHLAFQKGPHNEYTSADERTIEWPQHLVTELEVIG